MTRRDGRDVETVVCDVDDDRRAAPGPGDGLDSLDLVQAVRGQLTAEERWLSDQRLDGRDWATIATQLGVRPDAIRVKLARALDRVARKLGLDGPGGC